MWAAPALRVACLVPLLSACEPDGGPKEPSALDDAGVASDGGLSVDAGGAACVLEAPGGKEVEVEVTLARVSIVLEYGEAPRYYGSWARFESESLTAEYPVNGGAMELLLPAGTYDVFIDRLLVAEDVAITGDSELRFDVSGQVISGALERRDQSTPPRTGELRWVRDGSDELGGPSGFVSQPSTGRGYVSRLQPGRWDLYWEVDAESDCASEVCVTAALERQVVVGDSDPITLDLSIETRQVEVRIPSYLLDDEDPLEFGLRAPGTRDGNWQPEARFVALEPRAGGVHVANFIAVVGSYEVLLRRPEGRRDEADIFRLAPLELSPGASAPAVVDLQPELHPVDWRVSLDGARVVSPLGTGDLIFIGRSGSHARIPIERGGLRLLEDTYEVWYVSRAYLPEALPRGRAKVANAFEVARPETLNVALRSARYELAMSVDGVPTAEGTWMAFSATDDGFDPSRAPPCQGCSPNLFVYDEATRPGRPASRFVTGTYRVSAYPSGCATGRCPAFELETRLQLEEDIVREVSRHTERTSVQLVLSREVPAPTASILYLDDKGAVVGGELVDYSPRSRRYTFPVFVGTPYRLRLDNANARAEPDWVFLSGELDTCQVRP